MTLKVYRLRRILAATAIILTMVVAGMYFYARSKATNVLKSIPGKIGYDIKQTAKGFQFSKSDGKRTLFTVEASDIKEFKLNGKAELHNVNIVLYGRDSSRYDQIYGDEFAFNQKTGDVRANGEVQIDLVANPTGIVSPDQSTPKELKNPIHLKTRDLVFNKDTGNASTNERVEFQTPQAKGWAVGVQYAGKTNVLTLVSQIHLEITGEHPAVIDASHGTITNDPRQIVLDHPRLQEPTGTVQASSATFYLSPQNHVDRVLAEGNISTTAHNVRGSAQKEQPSEIDGHADQAEFLFVPGEDVLRTATMSGHVHLEQTGAQTLLSDAGRMVFDFAGQNELKKVHAVDAVRIRETKSSSLQQSGVAASPQDFELTAPAIDFVVAQGNTLKRAETQGAAQITIAQAQDLRTPNSAPAPQETVVTAGRFEAEFSVAGGHNHLAHVHGAPDARIVSSMAGKPDRVSTSESVDAAFLPQGGIDSITQTGDVAYVDGQDPNKRMQAWANTARYTPADQMLVLTGSPRVAEGGMATTANHIRINRATGEALAEGDVKSTYSEMKEQPNGALLASSSPIHATAQSMMARSSAGAAVYSGKARLWQDANVIEAPTITFDRDRRSVTAQGTTTQPVQTIVVEPAKSSQGASGKTPAVASPISITGLKLTYADSERRAHYEGGVVAKGAGFTASATTLDAYLVARSQASATRTLAGPGQLDRMVAQGDVLIQQPNRRAEGQKLVYTAAEDKFVLTGGPPSIFDAEQGKITGVSLTFFRHDDRVLVEGEASSPVVTTTRVAR
jgi:lipopolysaccharide export system protein LptA